jgi:hypothetical protein
MPFEIPVSLTAELEAERQALIAQGEAVLASKSQPRGNIVGDWQSTETVYALVDMDLFLAWREACLSWLAQVAGEGSQWHDQFLYNCRRAQFLEAVKGQQLLLRGVDTTT